jgi:hypothetical protein
MKLTPLLVLSLAGCSLYFDEADGPASGPSGPSPGPSSGPSPHGGPLPEKCGSPEVHVIGVYETRSDHSHGHHPTGEGRVRIDRPGDHVLVLSAYEPTDWKVSLAPGANIEAVTLIGYHPQSVNLTGVPVTRDSGCGYSFPYNGQGCDTDALLELARTHAGADVTTFHGCYHASEWTLHADGTAASNCDTAAGYEVSSVYAKCDGDGDGGGTGDWKPEDFKTFAPASCTGERYVRRDEKYGVWVGAILCGAKSYKLYMSEDLAAPFLEIADYAGHGQDHCELVNPAFTIPNEDDITSGGCTDCSVGNLIDLQGVPVYARAVYGEPFERVTSRFWADLTTSVYSCGVAIP